MCLGRLFQENGGDEILGPEYNVPHYRILITKAPTVYHRAFTVTLMDSFEGAVVNRNPVLRSAVEVPMEAPGRTSKSRSLNLGPYYYYEGVF